MPNLINETQKILKKYKSRSDLREQFYNLIKYPSFNIYDLGYFYQTHYKKFHNFSIIKDVAFLLKKFLHISDTEVKQFKAKFPDKDELYLAINERLNFNINTYLDLDWPLGERSRSEISLPARSYQGFFSGSISDIDCRILSWVDDPYELSRLGCVSASFWKNINSQQVSDIVWKRYISKYFPDYKDDRPISGKEKFKEFVSIFKFFKSYYQNGRIVITSEKFNLAQLIGAEYEKKAVETLGVDKITYQHLRAIEIVLNLFKVKTNQKIFGFQLSNNSNYRKTDINTYCGVTPFFMAGFCSNATNNSILRKLYVDIGWLLLQSGVDYNVSVKSAPIYYAKGPVAIMEVSYSVKHVKTCCSPNFYALIQLAQAEEHMGKDEFEPAQNLLNEVSQSHKLLLGRYIDQVTQTKRGFTLEYNDKQFNYLSELQFALDAKNECQNIKRIHG